MACCHWHGSSRIVSYAHSSTPTNTMSNYEKLSQALNDYINEVYRMTHGSDSKTASALAEMLSAELGDKEIEKLEFYLSAIVESKNRAQI